MSGQQHRLVIRSSGDPALATIHLDGQQLTFVSRVELVLDSHGQSEAKLTVDARLVDLDVDVAAFVTAHAEEQAAG